VKEEVVMPFKSKAQRRLFWAKVGRGEISKEKAEEWEKETPNKEKLPERLKKKPAEKRPAPKPRAKKRSK
jgi:hypothetical protein